MATGTTEFIDLTSADVYVPEVWGNILLVAREVQKVFAALVDLRYAAEMKGGDTYHARSVGNLSTQTKTQNGAITLETITETNTDITIATNEYNAIGVENIAEVQADHDMLKLYAGKQGATLALAVDDVLAGLVDDFGNTVGTLVVESTYDNLVRAYQYLNDAEAPMTGRAWIISPAAEVG